MSLRLSRNNRVLLLIGALAIASVGLGAGVYLLTAGTADRIDASTRELATLGRITAQLRSDIREQEAAVDDFVISRSKVSLSRFDAAVGRVAAASTEAHAQQFVTPGIGTALDTLFAAELDWRANVLRPAILAAEISDISGLARFRTLSISDQAAIDVAAANVQNVLDNAAADLADTESGGETVTLVGTSVAFAFLILSFGVALIVVRRFGRALERDARDAGILNRFTEVTSFATDDHEIAATNLVALGRLVRPDASVTHVLNRSKDRAVPEAVTGKAPAEVLALNALSRCAGIVRGAMYVADDLSDELSVHCPVYPAKTGTLACIPLDSGEPVGTVHLYWTRSNALPLGRRASVARVAEHAALAIGNHRLLAALHGQANTDPRTGLANSRAFDTLVEETLASRVGQEAITVLMLDIDHFKEFNDRNGHPAGDEALRVFGGVLRSCMREGDVAARYGGEEFAVLLPGVDAAASVAVAERIRARTESTIISLAPGQTDRITVSIGIASAPEQGVDRMSLLRIADEALYRAKSDGRNRIEGVATSSGAVPAGGAVVPVVVAVAKPRASRVGRTA